MHEIKVYNNEKQVVILPNEAVAKLVAMNNKFSALLCECIRDYTYEIHVQRPSVFNELMERLLLNTVTKIKKDTHLLLECDYWGLPYEKIHLKYYIAGTLYHNILTNNEGYYTFVFDIRYDNIIDDDDEYDIIKILKGLLLYDGYIYGTMSFALQHKETEELKNTSYFDTGEKYNYIFYILHIHKVSDVKRILALASK